MIQLMNQHLNTTITKIPMCILIFNSFPNTIDVLTDVWTGLLSRISFEVISIGVLARVVIDALTDVNVDVLRAVMTVLMFDLPALSEKSCILCCTPCNFWPMTALGFDRVLQTRMPSYQV